MDDDLKIVSAIDGQISMCEVEVLMGLATNLAFGNAIVEVGSYRGRSTIAMALGSLRGRKNKVYAIDPHVNFVGVLGAVFGPQDLKAFYENIVTTKVGEIVYVVSLPSANAAKAWETINIELLFIDGDHSYEGVRTDFESWIPYVIKNGIIAFHDYQVSGVSQLLQEIVGNGLLKFEGVVDEMKWYRKTS